jgi:hypothetical protein
VHVLGGQQQHLTYGYITEVRGDCAEGDGEQEIQRPLLEFL